MKAIVAIPARMASQRLPGKPLADIKGKPMIVRVWERAMAAEVGPVIVAAAEPEVVAAIEAEGGQAVLTDPALPSGSDRIHAALEGFDPSGRFDVVINLQGDIPGLEPAMLRAVVAPLASSELDIATLATPFESPEAAADPNIPKPVLAGRPGDAWRRALYFSRAPVPHDRDGGGEPYYQHIGIYAFRRAALTRFVSLPPSPLEEREKLEQLRALEAGMAIGVALVDSMPLSVDTPADLQKACNILN